MAPTPSPILHRSSSTPSSRQFHHLRRLSHHSSGQSSASRKEQLKPRDSNGTLQSTAVLESPSPPPSPPPTPPTIPSGPIVLPPEPSTIPAGAIQRQGPTQSGDVPGNIVVAVVVIVLVLGGLIGLIIGGELLRRKTKIRGAGASSPRSGCVGSRRSKHAKEVAGSPQQRTKIHPETFPRVEKTSTGLIRPPPALTRQRHRKLSDVWPICSLSRILYNRQPSSDSQVQPRLLQRSSPAAECPQTTWSEFSPVTLYVPPPRMALDRIPEECEEDCESQTNGDSAVTTRQAELLQNTLLDDFSASESSMTEGRCGTHDGDCQVVRDEDCKSLESSAPDMTSDGSGSSRSSTASLESLGRNDGESLREEVFELKRVQTRSMQMNKGVLLSLSLKTLEDSQTRESTHGELGCGPSGAPSGLGVAALEGGKDEEPNLAMLGGTFSAISLGEFPSPPSILPVIPSFVSGF